MVSSFMQTDNKYIRRTIAMNFKVLCFSLTVLFTQCVHGMDSWWFDSLNRAITAPDSQRVSSDSTYFSCPVEVPLGYDVYVILVSSPYIKRLGRWDKLTLAQKEEARTFFERHDALAYSDSDRRIILLAFGIGDVALAEKAELQSCLKDT